AARHRATARAYCARRRLLHNPEAVSQRRFLLGADLSGHGISEGFLPRDVRDPAHRRLVRAVGRDAARRRTENRAPAADLHRPETARFCRTGTTEMIRFTVQGSWFRVLVLGSGFAALAISPKPLALARASQSPSGGAAKPAAAVTFDSGRAYEHLRQVVNIGPRPAGSPAIERTRGYITDQLKALGITAVPQPFDAK